MADIMIAFLYFPNDPSHNGCAHQMYVSKLTEEVIHMYSVSSILGKEKRVYGENREQYAVILPPEQGINGFRVPSFIDCAKMYRITLENGIDPGRLQPRELTPALKRRIEEKIEDMKCRKKHMIYRISEQDFRRWNPRAAAMDDIQPNENIDRS